MLLTVDVAYFVIQQVNGLFADFDWPAPVAGIGFWLADIVTGGLALLRIHRKEK